jgi:hypothetical protein
MMVEFEKNARMLVNHANNDKPPQGGFFQNDPAVPFERGTEVANSILCESTGSRSVRYEQEWS